MKNLKKLLKPCRQLSYLLSVIILSIALFALHIIPAAGILFIVGCWQLLAFARSKRCGVCYLSVLTPEQISEFEDIVKDIGREFPKLKAYAERLTQLEKSNDELSVQLRSLRKRGLGSQDGVRWVGNKPFVTDECAGALTSVFVLDCAKLKGALDSLVPDAGARERIIALSAQNLGIEVRTALTTTEIPVPTLYVPQIIELVFRYGQARQYATVLPLGAGTVKLPRLKAGERVDSK